MSYPRLIALDLDGTLLNSKKELSPANDAALRKAHAEGAEIVLATGRFYGALPELLRTLPYVRYYLTVNGAKLCDRQTGRVLYQAEIPWAQAVAIMEYFETLPVIYDCYLGDAAYMSAALLAQADAYAHNDFYSQMMRLRHPVPELRAYLRERKTDVQKTMCLFRPEDMALRETLLRSLPGKFPGTVVTSSIPNNIEFNHENATKGAALCALADHLGISQEETLAFGDDYNDISMLQAAGVGVAMKNAFDAVKKAADAVTESCDRDGVAKFLQG